MMISTNENRIPSMDSIFSTINPNAVIQSPSDVSRRSSVQSGGSVGDVLDLYADSDSDSDSVFEQDHKQESMTVNNYSNAHTVVSQTSESNPNGENNATFSGSPSLNQLNTAQTTPNSQVSSSNYVSPVAMQKPQFKVVNHTVSTSFIHSDTTIAAINDSNQNTLNDSTLLHNHYKILDDDSTDNLEIEDSLIDLINQIGLEDNDVELEFNLDLLDELNEKGVDDNHNNKNKSKNDVNVCNSNDNIADLLGVDLSSSEEEDYDDNERFNSFFELSRANSLKRISTILKKRRSQSQIPTVIEEQSISQFEKIPERNEDRTENEHYLLERVETINQSEILNSIDENTNIDDFLSENTHGNAYLDPNPPPYAEFDVTEEEELSQKRIEFETIQEDFIPQEVNKEMSSDITKLPQRTISQRIRRELGGLNRQLSVDYYQLDRYLPPYRSMINPDQGYDYRTHKYVDATSNEFEIKPIDKNTTVVAIHKRKREGRIKSILLTTNNNIKQKLIDAAGDTLPLKTRTISMQSISSFNRNNVRPNIKFQTLPLEIVNLILNQLKDDQNTLVNCLYVNKTFSLLSKQILYYSPYFSSTYRFAQFVYLISNNSKLSSLVYVLDLSHIDIGITLNEGERAKLQDKMIYGSSGNRDSFFIDRDKKILAGWRDWKFRDHPLYGSFANNRFRAGSSSSASTVHRSSNTGSTDSVFDQRKNKSAGTLTLVNSRRRSGSGSPDFEHNLKNLKPKAKARQRSNSHTNSTQNISNGASTDGSIFKSLKNAFGKKNTAIPGKKDKQIKKKVSVKPKTTTSNSSTTKANAKTRAKIDSKIEVHIDGRLPFSTPHPKQNQFLSQYCFTKDIPVGHILHVLKECENLEEINFSDITVSADFELNDYEDFDWEIGKGNLLAKGKPGKILDKTVYWSDTDREMDIDVDLKSGRAVGLEISAVWKEMLKLNNVKKITLSNISSLEQSIVEAFVMRSNFKNKIEYLDCTGSGLVKRQEWDELKTRKEWRRYFKKLQR